MNYQKRRRYLIEMKIKRKNTLEIIELIIVIIMFLVCLYAFIKVKEHILKVTMFVVMMYLTCILINGIKILLNCYIYLNDEYLEVGYLDKITGKNLIQRLFTPFIYNFNHLELVKYKIELSEIKKIDYVKNIKSEFKKAKKFDIGIIDVYDDKYIIRIEQFNDSDIISLMDIIKEKKC